MSDMKDVYYEINWLVKQKDAFHPRGYHLKSMDNEQLLKRVADEVIELAFAQTFENRLEELSDVIAILIHYAIKNDIALGDISKTILEKLPKVFPEAYSKTDNTYDICTGFGDENYDSDYNHGILF